MFQSLDLLTLSFLLIMVKSQQELVKDVQCYIHSANQAHCSWVPCSPAPDLKFYYQLWNESFSDPVDSPVLQCSEYRYPDGVRTGFDLKANIFQSIVILINGTLNNAMKPLEKIFFSENVRPPALNWTVTKTGDQFLISWTPPDIPATWTYVINYTECNESKTKEVEKNETSLALVPHCPYSIKIKATCSGGWTPWSDVKYFDVGTSPWVYAGIVVPLVFAGLAVLVFVCFRKNKERIFPKVPQPRDLISDIYDNNNKSTVCNLYIPAKEEDNCKITLVEEPQINKLD
ncbi:hypothetical protein PFLUV_G00163520 [Perca fluviatilis]|uniref:Fibronectin type-III domain-containing protein n=1 Tax=Perca fluviatilis TaxID=8168 RepID=A0A6A5DXN0_PERFL|nr:interleukin-13 receptor subunit alpha-1-like [Perca fluviatilis]KAF1380417.1 hypothetical protein PFLUV_G00163520 [Perca fluviatilis]